MDMNRRQALLLGAALAAAPETHPASAADLLERNRRIGERYFDEVWNQGRLDVLDELLSPDYVNHTPSAGSPPAGPDGLKPIVQAIRQAFPDLHYRIEDVMATDDAVILRVVMTGTHHGSFFGLAPTGRRIEVNQINIERIRNGRIAEHWRVTDELVLMRQLGVVQ
jgi:steroid delta-isomerase-like uncharacterized protein